MIIIQIALGIILARVLQNVIDRHAERVMSWCDGQIKLAEEKIKSYDQVGSGERITSLHGVYTAMASRISDPVARARALELLASTTNPQELKKYYKRIDELTQQQQGEK